MSKPEFVYVTYIETTPEKLWQALTTSEFTKRYWWDTSRGLGLEGRLAVLAGACDGKTTDVGEVLEADPPRRLVLYASVTSSNEAASKERPSRVTFVLEPHGKLVKLTLTHRGFRGRQRDSRRHLQGLAGDPVEPQEHAGNRRGR